MELDNVISVKNTSVLSVLELIGRLSKISLVKGDLT